MIYTRSGLSGNNNTPATTSGRDGESVRPRTIDIAKYPTSIYDPKFWRKARIPSAVKNAGYIYP
jgi:hypothetical protein